MFMKIVGFSLGSLWPGGCLNQRNLQVQILKNLEIPYAQRMVFRTAPSSLGSKEGIRLRSSETLGNWIQRFVGDNVGMRTVYSIPSLKTNSKRP